jgi:hypothetical protein
MYNLLHAVPPEIFVISKNFIFIGFSELARNKNGFKKVLNFTYTICFYTVGIF